MFERFTDNARRTVVLAQEEARGLNHPYIGTEHLLLGLLANEGSAAAEIFAALGVGLSEARRDVIEIVGEGQGSPTGHIPFTPRAKKVLELSLREAIGLGHDHIGSEHILLGLEREVEGIAAQVLQRHGVVLDIARQAVSKHLASKGYRAEPKGGREVPNCPRCRSALTLGCRTMAVQSSDPPLEVMVIFCQVCGTNLGLLPA